MTKQQIETKCLHKSENQLEEKLKEKKMISKKSQSNGTIKQIVGRKIHNGKVLYLCMRILSSKHRLLNWQPIQLLTAKYMVEIAEFQLLNHQQQKKAQNKQQECEFIWWNTLAELRSNRQCNVGQHLFYLPHLSTQKEKYYEYCDGGTVRIVTTSQMMKINPGLLLRYLECKLPVK